MASDWTLSDRTRTAFAGHGVTDGSTLLDGASRNLGAPPDTRVAVSPSVLRAVAGAFHEAFRDATDHRGVPPSVEAALDDAVAWTETEFGDLDGAGVSLRDALLPAFYHQFAGFHRAYCGRSRVPEFER